MKRPLVAVFTIFSLAWLSPAIAVEANDSSANLLIVDPVVQAESRLRSAFGPEVKVSSVTPLAKGQIVEVRLEDGGVIHMTPDYSHFTYRDELYELAPAGVVNVSEQRQLPLRATAMANIADTETVFFPAVGDPKAVINVFTDIDCGYCQKLHQEIPQMNKLGISVRYLAYPRAGIKDSRSGELTDSYRKINYVWCQTDRKDAMTTVKSNQRSLSQVGRQVRRGGASANIENEFQALSMQMSNILASSRDCSAPIAQQYALGQKLGVSGTPAIIVDDGTLIPGYVEANELAKRLGIL